jgi:7,8-dihydropterin-6-yl-methyl-4-(beta-D-ribofuranosyl)aminobenzene 5'-phosphate synthase
MLRAIKMINAAKAPGDSKVIVDLHPNRPDFRGVTTPMMQMSLEADPTFAEIEEAGGTVSKQNEVHGVCDDFFLISGGIPRVTEYEHGFRRGARYSIEKGAWEKDELMEDERFVMCNVKGG